MTKRYSIAELRLMFPDTAGQVRLDMILATNHIERVAAVEKAIDHLAQDLTRTRHHRQHRNEDLLTTDVVSGLTKMGFQASHDNDVGGHCDIVVEGRNDFLWLAEAKVHRDYDWLYKGFQQLSTRYSGGLEGQDTGSLLIYCYNQNVAQMINAWKARLSELRPDLQFAACAANSLAFRSTHAHALSGRPYVVRHVSVALFFDPDDKR